MVFGGDSEDGAQLAFQHARQALADRQRGEALAAIITLRQMRRGGLTSAEDAEAARLIGELVQFARETALPSPVDARERLARELEACVACGCGELLVSRPRIEMLMPRGHTAAMTMLMTVCADCGDTRLRALDPGALARLTDANGDQVFHRIAVRTNERGPFR